LRNYNRQYVPFYSEDGQKKVWINCFNSNSKFIKWEKHIVNVDGGGRDFFSVTIDLTTGKYFDFWINAPI